MLKLFLSADRASFQARLFINLSKYLPQVDELEEDKQREWTLEEVGKEHLRNLRSINNQHRLHLQAVQDQHNKQLLAIEENGRLSPTKFNQVQEEIRQGELLDHKKTVKALERKNTEQEKDHARMIKMLDRVVNSQENQLKHQRFEMGEQERKFQQEMELKEIEVKELKELREMEVKELKEVEVQQERKHSQELQGMELKEIEVKELMELRNTGIETAWRVKVQHDAKVHKLEEDIKVLKSQKSQRKGNMLFKIEYHKYK